MISLPTIFKPNSHQELPLGPTPATSQWIEYISQVSKFSDASFPASEHQLLQLLNQETSPSHRAVLLAGLGHCRIREGQMLEGAQTLGRAYSLVPEDDPDTLAFVTIEMAVFLANIDQYDLALSFLDRIPSLTRHPYLLKLTDYYTLVQKGRLDDSDLLGGLHSSLAYFEQIEEFSTVAYHWKNIGNLHRKHGDFTAAENAYSNAEAVAREHGFNHIIHAVQHDRGMLQYHQGNLAEAILTLETVVEKSGSHYTQSFTMANMGFLLLRDKQIQTASVWFMKSLNLAVDKGVFHLIPGTAYYLGECHHAMGNMELAKYFYEKGFQTANELLQHQFSYSGDRLKAIQGYVNFLKEHQDIPSSGSQDFPFAIDKTLREIRGIFQGALLNFMVSQHGSNRSAIRSLGIADKTWYLIRDRVKPFTALTPPREIEEFIRTNSHMTWQTINREFDSRLIRYLFNQYGRNKKKLGEKLSVSYTYARQLTDKSQSYLEAAANPMVQG